MNTNQRNMHFEQTEVDAPTKVRDGWAEAFKRMHEQGDDVLIDGESANNSTWDVEEWQW